MNKKYRPCLVKKIKEERLCEEYEIDSGSDRVKSLAEYSVKVLTEVMKIAGFSVITLLTLIGIYTLMQPQMRGWLFAGISNSFISMMEIL